MMRTQETIDPAAGAPGDARPGLRAVRLGCALALVILAVIYAWGSVPQIGPDGIAYLDLADAFRRGDMDSAFNTLWSPLYPLLLALAFGIVRPAPSLEFAEVYVVNLLVFIGALASFDLMLRRIFQYRDDRAGHPPVPDRAPLPEGAFLVLGYTLFAFSSLELIQIDRATPDLLVAACVYLSTAFLLGTGLTSGSKWQFPLLGLSLGIGYLAKAPMFPLVFVYLGLAFLNAYRSRRVTDAAVRMLAAVVVFGLVSGSLAFAFLVTRGRLTLGDSGKLNYAWLINGLPYAHWQGQFPGFGRPMHPTRRVLDAPPVHEFASPIGGTYPPWFDPAYWNEGIKPRLDLKAHARALLRNTRYLLVEIVLRRQIAVFTAGLALAILGRRRWLLLIEPGPSWMLLLPALAAFGMYSLIHVENRFVAPFIVLMWLGILAALTVPALTEVKRAAQAILVAAAVGVMLPSITAHTLELLTNPRLGGGEYSEWRIADGLRKAGLKPGDHVAVVGFSLGAYWARLAQVRIVAEICAERPRPPWNCGGEQHAIRDFWVASPDTKDQVYTAFRRAGARAVVAGSVGDIRLVGGGIVLPDEWLRIPGTSYFVYFLDR